jgi:hypothetical protein
MEEVKPYQFCGWSGISLTTNESLVCGVTLPMMSVFTRSGYRINGRRGGGVIRMPETRGRWEEEDKSNRTDREET